MWLGLWVWERGKRHFLCCQPPTHALVVHNHNLGHLRRVVMVGSCTTLVVLTKQNPPPTQPGSSAPLTTSCGLLLSTMHTQPGSCGAHLTCPYLPHAGCYPPNLPSQRTVILTYPCVLHVGCYILRLHTQPDSSAVPPPCAPALTSCGLLSSASTLKSCMMASSSSCSRSSA